MFTRDVLLTLADHGFFNPKWSARIHAEWTGNLISRLRTSGATEDRSARIDAVRRAMDRAFPDALIRNVPPDSGDVLPVDPKDRHVVMAAVAARADAIVTFNLKDFAGDHLRCELAIEVLHPDVFVRDLIDLNEKRAAGAFRELRARKRQPPWQAEELIDRARRAGLLETAAWLEGEDVRRLL
ncbi:PIN domain-containing protein [Trinickia symbiotica]|nr:PIN domain-containing protein [Trinickia symbiotica]